MPRWASRKAGPNSFNGATSRRTWRVWGSMGVTLIILLLQWGHVQKDMESQAQKDTRTFVCGLQWGHVQKDMERNLDRDMDVLYMMSFNGATSRRTWRVKNQ